MNRTDRLYAMVEELRAIAPRPRSARWLAHRFEVCSRTVERDIGALQQAGVPIYAQPGRAGGYVLDKTHSLPPVNITPSEAVAVAVALEELRGTPFHDAARSALAKVVAVMPEREAAVARELAGRVHLETPPGSIRERPATPAAVAEAMYARQVLRFRYVDRRGNVTRREVEPLAYLGGVNHWYLMAWCRMRGELRAFRLDRIADPAITGESAPPRRLDPSELAVPFELRSPALGNESRVNQPGNTDTTLSPASPRLVTVAQTEGMARCPR
jgi:predicted DNA-binding transcriptional regulator YafY